MWLNSVCDVNNCDNKMKSSECEVEDNVTREKCIF